MRSFKKLKTLKGALLAVLATAFFALSGCSSSPYKIDRQATAAAPWKVGEIIGTTADKNDDSGRLLGSACFIYGKGRACDYERVFLGVSKEGHYLVQDFYTVETVQRYLKDSPGKRVKGTDPYLMSGKAAVQFSLLSPAKIADIHGRITAWYLTGHKEFEGEVKNGLKQGRWTAWDENGSIHWQMHYVDSIYEGASTIWDVDGQMISDRHYSKGYPHGYQKSWYPDGKMKSSEHYIDGKEDGLSEFWDLYGKIVARNLYVMGKRHGEQEEWLGDERINNGRLKILKNYVNGEVEGEEQWWWYGDGGDKGRRISGVDEAMPLLNKYDEEKEN